MEALFEASWRFQGRHPVLPPRNLWDMGQLLAAVRPDTLLTLPFVPWSVADALKAQRLYSQQRLRTFLDLQLKLYSQVSVEETALLYAATALRINLAPQGVYHLQGSMQALSAALVKALERHGGQLRPGCAVDRIHFCRGRASGITLRRLKTGRCWCETADEVVANVPVQNLLGLLADAEADPAGLQQRLARWQLRGYARRVARLPRPSGAFVLYLGVDRRALPANCPPHLQLLADGDGPVGEQNSLFVSVSQAGDGRAPAGCATITASAFTDPQL